VDDRQLGVDRGDALLLAATVVLPMAGLALLLAAPHLDRVWEQHPSHFWLVLWAAATNAILAYATGVTAVRREDARLVLVSVAFLAAGGFLVLHALATPGVLLSSPNAGFVVATPVGLLIAGVLFAVSSLELRGAAAGHLVKRSALLRNAVLVVMLVWLVASLVGGLRPSWLAELLSGVGWSISVGAYLVLFWNLAGQTPGMRVMRLRLANRSGDPPGVGRSLVRLIGLVLAIVPLFAGFLPVLVDGRRRALQDYLAGTTVVPVDEPAAAATAASTVG